MQRWMVQAGRTVAHFRKTTVVSINVNLTIWLDDDGADEESVGPDPFEEDVKLMEGLFENDQKRA